MWFSKKEKAEVSAPSIDERTIEEQLKSFIAGKADIDSAQIHEDTKLFSSGFLDSLAFVQMIAFIEKRFKINLSTVTDVSFDTLDRFGVIVEKINKALERSAG